MDNLTIVKNDNSPFITIESPIWGSVRGRIDENGKVWFVGRDLAVALGYSKPSNALAKNCKKSIISTITLNQGSGNPPLNITLIPESDMWRLVMRSYMPKAEEFQDWICEEVIPALRKASGDSLSQRLPSNYIEALKALTKAEEEKLALSKTLEVTAAERDEAIRTKAWISGKKTATAMGTAGGYAIKNQKLSEENAELRGKIWGLLNNSSIKYCIEALLSLPVAR